MKTLACVPCKGFAEGKGRLRERYSDREVSELGRAMLADVVAALVASPRVDATVVVTGDPEVSECAEALGASSRLLDPDPGLNPAIEEVSARALRDGFDAELVVLGDLPLLRTRDVDAIVEVGHRFPIVLVPSADGGTAALLRRPPGRIPACFGRESAAAHAAQSERTGLRPAGVPSIEDRARIDLDTPEDAARILELGDPCRTLDLLRKFAG